MWIWLDSNGTVKKYLAHGKVPTVGTTDFQIFAYFDGLDTERYDSATIKFRRPDQQGSTYPALFMELKTLSFAKTADDGSATMFVDGTSYTGFYFDFAKFTEDAVALLDTPGLWEASIELLDGTDKKTNVSGLITFSVGSSSSDDVGESELTLDQLLQNLVLNQNYMKSSASYYVRAVADLATSASTMSSSVYPQNSIVYDQATKGLYRITSSTEPITYELVMTFVDVESGQTILGVKTFDDDVNFNNTIYVDYLRPYSADDFNVTTPDGIFTYNGSEVATHDYLEDNYVPNSGDKVIGGPTTFRGNVTAFGTRLDVRGYIMRNEGEDPVQISTGLDLSASNLKDNVFTVTVSNGDSLDFSVGTLTHNGSQIATQSWIRVLYLSIAGEQTVTGKKTFAGGASIGANATLDVLGTISSSSDSKQVTILNGLKLQGQDGSAFLVSDTDGVNFAVSFLAYNGSEVATLVDVAKKQDLLTDGQMEAVNSGVTASKVANYDAYNPRLESLENRIKDLTGAMHFVGVSTSDPISGATIPGVTDFSAGDVCLYNKKEYIYDGTSWHELGDEGSYLTKNEAATEYVPKTRTINGHALDADVEIKASEVPDAATKSGNNQFTGNNQFDGDNIFAKLTLFQNGIEVVGKGSFSYLERFGAGNKIDIPSKDGTMALLSDVEALLNFEYVWIGHVGPFIVFYSDSEFTISHANTQDGVLQYSLDGESWHDWEGEEVTSTEVFVKGQGNSTFGGSSSASFFSMTGTNVSCSGNLEYLRGYESGNYPKMAESCYCGMFMGCNCLISPPELPATELTADCYEYMFSRCRSLKVAPKLPATTLANFCYSQMFNLCTSLTAMPELPATTLATRCYFMMFHHCTSLVAAQALPATELKTGCYRYMFSDCTSLTIAPELPATRLSGEDYFGMFSGCTSLVNPPKLPATILAIQCYVYMFQNCTSLKAAPELPATTLASSCYGNMFSGCTSLTSAPSLPATTLMSYCYINMFSGCTSLTSAPSLPATTLMSYCYSNMFSGCTKLIINSESSTGYSKEWRIPSSGTISATASNWNTNMLSGTGGTQTADPTINTTYYIKD